MPHRFGGSIDFDSASPHHRRLHIVVYIFPFRWYLLLYHYLSFTIAGCKFSQCMVLSPIGFMKSRSMHARLCLMALSCFYVICHTQPQAVSCSNVQCSLLCVTWIQDVLCANGLSYCIPLLFIFCSPQQMLLVSFAINWSWMLPPCRFLSALRRTTKVSLIW